MQDDRVNDHAYAACRRLVLKSALGTACLALSPVGAGAVREPSDDARKLAPQSGDQLAYPSWENDGRVVSEAEIPLRGAPLLVYPQDPASGITRERSRLNQILLVRFELGELSADTRAVAADGIVAYSGICTHTACGVSEWNAEVLHFVCPCHASEFDPRNRAAVIGGPATRALPALPIVTSGANLVVAGDFTSRVGATTT